MRYAVFSDIHGNLEAFKAAEEAFKKERIGRYIFAGDIVGYGANPDECIEKIKALNPALVCGNHDQACCGLLGLSHLNETAQKAVIWATPRIDKKNIDFLKNLNLTHTEAGFTVVHGTLYAPEKFDYLFKAEDAISSFFCLITKLCFVGHTHVPSVLCMNKGNIEYVYGDKIQLSDKCKYVINPGSLGQPRNGDPHASFIIYDDTEGYIEFKKIPYDINTAANKILDAGLPERLAKRLYEGN